MIIRPFELPDYNEIDRIYRTYHHDDFGIPDLSYVLTQRVVEGEDRKIVAFGMVKLFAEAVMVLDLGASQKDKVKALKLLMETAITDSKAGGIEQLHAFVKDPVFVDILKRHFKFINCSGEALVCVL